MPMLYDNYTVALSEFSGGNFHCKGTLLGEISSMEIVGYKLPMLKAQLHTNYLQVYCNPFQIEFTCAISVSKQ